MDDRQGRICSHEAQFITALIVTLSFARQQRSLILICKEPVALALSVSVSLQISEADHDPAFCNIPKKCTFGAGNR
jgi:hypothetical protein